MMEEAGPHIYVAGSHQVDANPHQAESRGSQHGDPHGVLNEEKVVRGVCAQLIPPKVTFVGRVMFPMQSMTGTCNVRLTS